MEDLIAKIPVWVNVITIVITALVAVATAVVQLTSSKKDDEKLGTVKAFLVKIQGYLPTLGINPSTKKLEEENAKLKAENAKVSDDA